MKKRGEAILLKTGGFNTSDFSPTVFNSKNSRLREERKTAGFSLRIAPSSEFLLFLLFFIVILILNFPSAEATYRISVYSGNLYSGDSGQTKTGLNFSVFVDPKNLIASVNFRELNKTFIVRNSSCELGFNLSVCLRGPNFGYYNTTQPSELGSYSIIYSYTISVFSYRAVMSVDRRIPQKQFLPWEATEAILSFTNGGDRTAVNVHYYDYYPEEFFEITNITGECKKEKGSVYWKGSLGVQHEINCRYILKSLKPTTYLSKAVLNYSDPEEPKTLESGEIELKVSEHPINLTYSLENKKGENVSDSFLGNELVLKINFTNTAKKPYYIRYFRLDYSRYEKTPYYRRQYNESKKLFFEESILANETRQYTYPITTEFSGKYNITLTAEYFENDIGKKVVEKIPLSVYLIPISAIFVNSTNVSKFYIQNTNHDDYYFATSEVYLKTLDKEFKTRDITAELKSGWSKEILNYPENLAGNFNLNVSMSYTTKFNELIISNYSFGSFAEKPKEAVVQNITAEKSLTAN